MLALAWLIVSTVLFTFAAANTEKTIFTAPRAWVNPDIRTGVSDLRLPSLRPTKRHNTLRTQLIVEFPSKELPRGTSHWYILDGLREGQRYEVRVCWPATQPTEFRLDTYPIQEIFKDPELLSAIAAQSELDQELPPTESEQYHHSKKFPGNSTVLLLNIQSAADFFTTKRSLMSRPPPVDVDIILDPFLLNLIPSSLVPTIAYIVLIAFGSSYLATVLWRWLLAINEKPTKTHYD